MDIRPYQTTDLEPLLTVFRRNVPHAFGPDEVADYAEFLMHNTDPYFVAEHDGQVVGACGHYVAPDGRTARLIWIFSDPDAKGLGIGSGLVHHNLNAIRRQPGIELIECRTSQVAYRFFERFGFRLQATQPDYWAPGLDLYAMNVAKKDLTSSENL